MHIYGNIKNVNTPIEKIEEHQQQFKLNLKEIITGNSKHKSKHQWNTIENFKSLHDSREEVIKLYNDHAKIRSQGMYETKYRIGLKTITPKQMLQRLPITLAKAQAGNYSENYVLIVKLSDKLDLRKGEKVLLDQISVFTMYGKTWKAHTKIINLKYQFPHGTMNLNYQMDHILYQIFKNILNIKKT